MIQGSITYLHNGASTNFHMMLSSLRFTFQGTTQGNKARMATKRGYKKITPDETSHPRVLSNEGLEVELV